MSVVRDIGRAYLQPRAVFRERVVGADREGQALAILFAACVLIFASQAPVKQRLALETGADFQQEMGGVLFAWLFIVPLAAYLIAWASHGFARLIGGKGTSFSARIALFWALLVASPLWLLNGLVAGFIGPGPQAEIVGAVALLAFLAHWVVNLSVAEREEIA